MQRYFIQLSYLGTRYHGWQVQPNGNSIQEVLEKSLSVVLRENIAVTGAGRTDAGVHASFYVAHFDSLSNTADTADFVYCMNKFLPDDIAIQTIRKVDPEFHARFSAQLRTYLYVISRVKNPFNTWLAYYFPAHLDLEKMNFAAGILHEYEDFTSFSRLHTDVKTNLCHISVARWEERSGELVFTITADRFLRNMVRAIVGTLIDVGRGKISAEDFRKIIEKKDRQAAGASAPAHGLFLAGISYPDEFFT